MNKRTKKTVLGIVTNLIFAAVVFADSMTNIIYEAENAEEMVGVTVQRSETGFLGTGYADFGSSGSCLKWTRIFSDEGDATLTFRYSNGSQEDSQFRPTELYVNDNRITLVKWPGTDRSWKIWKTQEFKVTLQRGVNTVALRQTTAVGPNIDQLIVTSRPAELKTVPNVEGFSRAAATSRLTSAGLIVGTVTTECSSKVSAGLVIRQSPEGGSLMPVGAPVDLVISLGGTITVGQKENNPTKRSLRG